MEEALNKSLYKFDKTIAKDLFYKNDYPWEVKHPEDTVIVRFGGYVERTYVDGETHFEHKDYQCVCAVPYDVPIVGEGGKNEFCHGDLLSWKVVRSACGAVVSRQMPSGRSHEMSKGNNLSNDCGAKRRR